MDAPNPDSGEEYFHTNTQLFNTLDEHNRFKIGEAVSAPWNAPEPGAVPTMDGFVTDYISTFTAEIGRQPTYEEYAQIMTGYTPEQVPVLSGIARGFGVFDHWFCEVPSQTFMNRSFWTAATSSGFVVNSPVSNFIHHNTAETLFERLEAHGRTWKVYVHEPMWLSFAGLIHMPRLAGPAGDALRALRGVRAGRGRGDSAGLQPDRAEHALGAQRLPPRLRPVAHPGRHGHPDGPAVVDPWRRGVPGRSLRHDQSGRLTGRLQRLQHPVLHRLGRARRNLRPRPPGPVPPPDPSAPAGQLDFTFERSGYRVPAIIVSPWVDEGIVINDEHRHTSMIATLRKVWGLGDAFTARDAAAAPFDHLLSRDSPRDPAGWPEVEALPVPEFHMDMVQMGKAFSILGKTAGAGMLERAQQAGLAVPAELTDPNGHPSTEQIIAGLRSIGAQIFPRLATHI